MTEPICVHCGRPTLDGYACSPCADRAAAQLAEVRDMVGAARDIATGQASHRGGGGSGKPGSRLPFDLGATARLDAVQRELGTWLRHVGEERGTTATTVLVPMAGEDPIVVICERLMQHLEWWRHRPEVDEFLGDVEACARVVRGLARGPAAQKYLGPCGAEIAVEPCLVSAEGQCTRPESLPSCNPVACATTTTHVCDGDVYAREGASVGRCRTCGAEVGYRDRREWLDAEARSHAFRAAQIAEAYGINVKTIRSWADRGHLVAHGHDRDQRPLYNVGDVLDLAAGDAARREEARAKRARRMEQRSGEEAA